MEKLGDDIGFNFDYNGVHGTLPFNIRFDVDNLDRNGNVRDYDYVEWLIYTEVVSIDSLTGYTLYSENVLPIEVSYLDGDPYIDDNGDSGFPIRRLISVRVDTSAMDWSLQEPVLRMYGTWLSDAGYTDQVVSVWDVIGGYYDYDVTPETTWLEKILNAVSSGFNSVSSTLSDILDALGGGSGGDDLVEGGDQIADAGSGLKDDIGKIEDFEQEHFGALDSNMGTIVGGGDLTALAAPLAFVQRYVNLIIAGIPSNYLVIFTLPILFGIFMYIVGHPIRAPRPDTSGDQVTRETFTTTTVLAGKNVGATTTTRTVTVSQEIGRVHNE